MAHVEFDEQEEQRAYARHQLLIHIMGPTISIVVHILLVALLLLLLVGSSSVDPTPELTIAMKPQAPPEEISCPIPDTPDSAPSIAPTALVVETPIDIAQVPSESKSFDSLSLVEFTDGQALPGDKISFDKGRGEIDNVGTGSGKEIKGDLTGYLYDLKRDRHGKSRKWNYASDVKNVVKNSFNKKSLSKFKKIPTKKYLSHLFIPKQSATNAPKAFNVETSMKPKGFFVHYTGVIQPKNFGKFRFVGHGDDLLMVLIDGKVVLEANWGFSVTDWTPQHNVKKYMSFTGQPLVYGNWVNFNSNRPKRIDLIYGESPGGLMSAVLMIEKKNRFYQTAKNGRKILPIFAVQPLSGAELKRLGTYKAWKFPSNHPHLGYTHTKSHTEEEEVAFLDID